MVPMEMFKTFQFFFMSFNKYKIQKMQHHIFKHPDECLIFKNWNV